MKKDWNKMGEFFVRVEYENGTVNEYFMYEDVWYDYFNKALENDKAVTHIEVYTVRERVIER